MSAVMTLQLGGRTFELDGVFLNIAGDGTRITINGQSIHWSDLYSFAVGYNTAMNRKAWEATS
jgi:hypothetical protein